MRERESTVPGESEALIRSVDVAIGISKAKGVRLESENLVEISKCIHGAASPFQQRLFPIQFLELIGNQLEAHAVAFRLE